MRKRIYWLLPDHANARRAMNELLLARIGESHIHFMASDEASMDGLHAASILQSSDLIGAAQIGSMLGAGIGAATGVLAAYQLDAIIAQFIGTPAAVVVALAAGGAVLGAWFASMIGSSAPSRRLRRFEAAMARGEYLLMVDVPNTRIEEIEALLERRHPAGHFEGLEPNVPAFP